MTLTAKQMKVEAHNSALQHDPYLSRKTPSHFWKRNEAHIEELRSFVDKLRRNQPECAQPAEEWLLDNKEFIEEQVLMIKDSLSKAYLKMLPHLKNTGELRVLSICEDYVHLTDGDLNKDSFMDYLKAYQEVSVLTIAEVWALPIIMQVALIRHLAKGMKPVEERHEICKQVAAMLSDVRTEDLTPEKLKEVIEKAGYEMPLSGPVIVHLVQHLRERADYSATVGEWLICKLENGPESLDHIMSYEYQLQAGYQVTTGNIITSMRQLTRWDWQADFQELSIVEQTLRKEASGVYPRMDFSSRETLRKKVEFLARRMSVPENLVASQALELADEVASSSGNQQVQNLPKTAFVSYYLLEAEGLASLRKALKMCSKPKPVPENGVKRRASQSYFSLFTVLFLAAGMVIASLAANGAVFTPVEWVLLGIIILLPASEWAVTAAHWMIERVTRPMPLLRYDLSEGVPEDAKTMVVIPVIWSQPEEVEKLSERLELHYLANKDSNIHFALLGDFKDSHKKQADGDRALLNTAQQEIARLNKTYPDSSFHLFHRKRVWNQSENIWMCWERKRGKLVEFVELLKGKTDTTFDVVIGDTSKIKDIRYIITLDADTELPFESARRMIGTMHLPFNRPKLNQSETRVVEGYGVLQPRIGMSHEAANRSRFASLWAADQGIDPYSFAVSDPYQDGLGEGIFTGKGIFDLDAFHHVLCDRIPDNRLLSHDLLEGGFLRAGLMSDIELVDDHPAKFIAHQKRLHRWVRGDWQLLLWLMPKSRNRRGELVPSNLSILTRWQIIDNLRRSLMVPALFLILLGGLTVFPGSPVFWTLLVLATLFLPVIRQLVMVHHLYKYPKGLFYSAAQAVVTLITMPYQTVVLMDAIIRTLYRLFVSKRRLLEWTPAAEVDRNSEKRGAPVLSGLYGGYALTALFFFAVFWTGSVLVQTLGAAFIIIWAVAPLIIQWMDAPEPEKQFHFSQSEKEELTALSREIWDFYEDFVTEGDNWLPPDNIQVHPPKGIAHRTSPTNIGLYLCSVLAARDFEFIDTAGMIDRIEKTIYTVERLKKWEGHLYNWYDTITLKPLNPQYVSTVDSGNLTGCLIVLKEGLAEWLDSFDAAKEPQVRDRRDEQHQLALSEELAPLELKEFKLKKHEGALESRGARLLKRIEKLIDETNYRPLYNSKAKLFSLGYHVDRHKLDDVLYDLMASEARQASYIAIALGQVPVSHWTSLGRTMTKAENKPVLLSWSGTMFEYLMPNMFMKTYKGSLWETTYEAVVSRQIAYARQRGVPFGVSESGYYAYDYDMNYQYRAFGVPGLGFKRGLEQDLVVSPYATVLSLPFSKKEGLNALNDLEKVEARGKYGFYEAIDFTRERLPKDSDYKVVQSYMAHHQGMSLLTLVNLLHKDVMVTRFHRNKALRAAELLLQERVPNRPKVIDHHAINRKHEHYLKAVQSEPAVREYSSPHTPVPEVCTLSNGKFMTVISNTGSGYSQFEGRAVTRWRHDPVKDSWGSYIYIRDTSKDEVWSPSFQPGRTEAEKQSVQFNLGRALFLRETDEMETSMEVCVSPEWPAEVRRLTLTNTAEETKIIEVTTFSELALAHSIADEAHPAFSKLFIRTSYDAENACLVAGRRPREAGEQTLWAAHTLTVEGKTEGQVEYETDRGTFIGRGRELADPQGIRSRLQGKTGSVADPAFVMRRRITLHSGEQIQLFAVTSVGETEEEAVDVLQRFSSDKMVERAFQMAWTRTEIELRNLQLTPKEAMDFQILAGRVLYSPPLKRERERYILSNEQGQSKLWQFGISGDRPVAVVRVRAMSDMAFVGKILTGHEYLRRLGILFDLVILNELEEGYFQELQEALQQTVEHGVDRFGEGAAGVHVIAGAHLNDQDQALFLSVARVVLHSWGAGLRSQLRIIENQDLKKLPKKLTAGGKINKWHTALRQRPTRKNVTSNLLFYNGWGGFSPDGKTYRIILKKDKHLPAPWINVIANPDFGCFVSELGTGYTWWRNSRECKLTPWSNDPVLDPPGEKLFIRDEENGDVWGGTASPGEQEEPYVVTHGRGFTKFEHERNAVAHTMTVYVPLEDPVKIVKVTLRNHSLEPRKLSLTYYAEWVLGVNRQSNSPFIVTDWHEDKGVLTARNNYQETFREATAFLGMFSEGGTEDKSFTADRNEFIGRNRSLEDPAAMKREQLSGRTGTFNESCGALQAKITLQPDSEKVVYILLGCDASQEKIDRLVHKYSQDSNCQEALKDVEAYWENTLEHINVQTPSREMDILLNGWLVYQSLACRMWGRSAFYQSGGAYGYRDQLQDSLSLLHIHPGLTRKQILLHAAHQYEEGDVQHWWHEETHMGIRTLFSDDLLWLPYAVSRYVEHTGDLSITDEVVPFLKSAPLQEGEHERYEPTVVSEETGTVYDHCLRAIEKALSRTGEHGMPLIGVGDWNDGMNLVGAEGRGESVWLGWFLCDILKRFEDMPIVRNDAAKSSYFRQKREELISALNEHGWDGQWYRRAFTDQGNWLGSNENDECRIDAIAQSWSVISGAAPKKRALQAMDSFNRELVDRNLSVLRLLTPPFDKTEDSPGYIQGYPPGIRENGAQYTHGVIWSIVAYCQLGKQDLAMEMFQLLNPITHTRTDHEVREYKGEPYVMAADVYTADPHKGQAGWTWYTGAAGWMYQAGLEWILGIRRRGEKLVIDPCIPEEWPGYSFTYAYGASQYDVEVVNKNSCGNMVRRLIINGEQKSTGDTLFEVPLNDDGRMHKVKVYL
ncbi:GH36-type glycosyl hydrolase domain-containing protein [Salipaludibacillus aurantiacus]|uniref:Cellobiose phosphorylase n=1 Tax=Salipaludibacillus aurantiacus TaxID=1601833 RepID=A0A1H9SB91_9BACI|nr:glucoamylase family protein [Salipaludibacillus aurantiacus]SER82231.1 Cellobiose phosphorylase [Salipaludibacillus aurantiacus]